MTIQQLRCFVTAAKYLNIRRAAEELYIAQPAVTHHIQSLENELNVLLFVRSNRQIRLTEQGKVFYKEAVDILDQIETAVDRVHLSPDAENILRIAYETNLQPDHIAEIYRAFHKEFPGVYISSMEMMWKDGKSLLMDGKVDIAFLPGGANAEKSVFSYLKLGEGQRCCVVPKNHALAAKEFATAEDLNGETLILLDAEHSPPSNVAFQRYIRAQCTETKFCFSGSSIYSLPMIEAGIGIALMPDFICPKSDKVVLVPYRPEYPIEFGLMWMKSNQSDKLRQFVRIACEKFGRSQASEDRS